MFIYICSWKNGGRGGLYESFLKTNGHVLFRIRPSKLVFCSSLFKSSLFWNCYYTFATFIDKEIQILRVHLWVDWISIIKGIFQKICFRKYFVILFRNVVWLQLVIFVHDINVYTGIICRHASILYNIEQISFFLIWTK